MKVYRIKKGESIKSFLVEKADSDELSGFFVGLGSVSDVEIGYYDIDSKDYNLKNLKGTFELVSLTGNISWVDDESVVHMHAALSDREGSMIGGHLNDATVAVTVEISVNDDGSYITRSFDEETGLNLIDSQVEGEGDSILGEESDEPESLNEDEDLLNDNETKKESLEEEIPEDLNEEEEVDDKKEPEESSDSEKDLEDDLDSL